MSSEKSAEQQPIESSDAGRGFSFRDANLMQADLIRRSGIDPLKWVDKNAFNFREIIKSRPDVVELYHRNPEMVEELIGRQLKKMMLH